jgi:hypothetical protein
VKISGREIIGRLCGGSRANRKIAFVLCALLLSSGCASTGYLIRFDPKFDQRGIGSIALLPVVDRRRDRSANIDFEQEIRMRASRILEKKGYQVVTPPGPSESDLEGKTKLEEMDLGYIVSLNPPQTDSVMVIYLDDVLSNYQVFSYTFKIEAIGIMASKRENAELWRAKGIGNGGQAGLVSGLTQGLSRSDAFDQCIGGLLSTLPNRKTKSSG